MVLAATLSVVAVAVVGVIAEPCADAAVASLVPSCGSSETLAIALSN